MVPSFGHTLCPLPTPTSLFVTSIFSCSHRTLFSLWTFLSLSVSSLVRFVSSPLHARCHNHSPIAFRFVLLARQPLVLVLVSLF